MSVLGQFIEFLEFFLIGLLLAIIFDFFRAYRKFKIPSSKATIVQDIIYFIIATIVVSIGVINILDSSFRLYVIIAIMLGVVVHINKFSKYTIKFFLIFFKTSKSIFEFLNITLAFYKQILTKLVNLFKKILKKCCKSFFYVINFNKCKNNVLHKKTFLYYRKNQFLKK